MGIGAIVVALLAIGVAIGSQTNNGDSATTSNSADESSRLSDLARRDAADAFAIGDVDAPVVIIEYADFTCPYCGVFAVETFPTLFEKYIEPGHVRFEWRDTPILTDHSESTAIAGRAAAEQNLFWEFNHEIFVHTVAGSKDYNRDTLIGLAGRVDGLDVAEFTTALDDPALADAVRREGAESRSLGVTATPTFIVGDEVLQGAQPVYMFEQILDSQLAEDN
ncbi:thioredoxin domain-containing protein [Rhodococcus sp. HNM0563]|uniref:DsbA family protein n=1 Tax=unclassified Rhodococcus (in: high G+C Gram-positive bacteria) TaxID=192944 RepID=UPI001469B596|nr:MULTISPECIES: thioredoxin domain-containing protein [unclassified Rhodococcus (in: high G+C Gram-positive bacteria)]MCK0089299.1 DsbA family protein [Rhodococcus sp. F64268]NLU62827.1 thioredoxin domain-containing protein [Rhodococcus sp. HNM0563]